MLKPSKLLLWSLSSFIVCSMCFGEPAVNNNNDWKMLWNKRTMPPMPAAVTVHVDGLSGLGEDLENQEWLMVPTKYHQICFQSSIDPKKISEVYYLIDNIYEFLQKRTPDKFAIPKTPIRAFIVPNQRGRSRCSFQANAMRTGDQGDLIVNITSFLHEETHIFNMAYLVDKPQGWWAGEYFCQYYQRRAEITARRKNVRKEIHSKIAPGPKFHLAEIEASGRDAFEESFAALYFFEQRYGQDKLDEFRRFCLLDSKNKRENLENSMFETVFGKDTESLEKEWLAYYKLQAIQKTSIEQGDERLQKTITYMADKKSVQNVVRDMAQQAGIGYNWDKSQQKASSICRRWLNNINIQNKPLGTALQEILNPLEATFTIENGSIVLLEQQI